jgi:Zn-dependent metalloprotease
MKKNSVTLIIVLFVSILMSSWLQAGDLSKPDSLKSSKIEGKKVQPKPATVAEPAPAKISNDRCIPYRGEVGGDRVEDSYRFLETYKDSYGLINPRQELKLKGIIGPDKISPITTLIFYQTVNGVKVASEIRLHFEPNGLLNGTAGQIDTNARKVNTNPAISEEQAKQIAFTDTLNINAKPEAVEMELLIARFPDGLRLVWSFGVINGGGDIGSWGYLIDAQTGKILAVSSALRR